MADFANLKELALAQSSIRALQTEAHQRSIIGTIGQLQHLANIEAFVNKSEALNPNQDGRPIILADGFIARIALTGMNEPAASKPDIQRIDLLITRANDVVVQAAWDILDGYKAAGAHLPESFSMVYAEGRNSPTTRHGDPAVAQREAERIARKEGVTTYVMEATQKVVPTTTLATTPLRVQPTNVTPFGPSTDACAGAPACMNCATSINCQNT